MRSCIVDLCRDLVLGGRAEPGRGGHHTEAALLLAQHGTRDLITTNHVRAETWTYIGRKAGHRSAVEFLDMLAASRYVAH